MPTAVTHILVPLFIIALIRDLYLKTKRFSLHYVLIAGIGGAIPDLDILIYIIIKPLWYTFEQIHRHWLHSIFVPIVLIILALIFTVIKTKQIGRQKLKLNIIFLMLAFGIFTHIVLDGLIQGEIYPLSPIFDYKFGLNAVSYLPEYLQGISIPLFEGILLLLWLIYLEWKHKISDFI